MFLSACSLMSVCVSVRLSVWPPICMPMWKYVRLSLLLSTLLYASIEWLIVLDLTALWDSISAYIGPPPREGERKEKRQTREKMSKQPPPAPTASARSPCPTIIEISRMPRNCRFTQRLRITRSPLCMHPWMVYVSMCTWVSVNVGILVCLFVLLFDLLSAYPIK